VVEFNTTKEENTIIRQIVTRYEEGSTDEQGNLPKGYDRLNLIMDLEATHCNGCPMDFDRLLGAPDLDFYHDLNGIASHLDRETGKLQDFFLPRCSKPEEQV
jgi:hypothetical protein